jgi:hypothetical protein
MSHFGDPFSEKSPANDDDDDESGADFFREIGMACMLIWHKVEQQIAQESAIIA